MRDYLEAAKANGLSTATLKQHMAAIRTVKAPRQKLGKDKTPVLTAEEAGEFCETLHALLLGTSLRFVYRPLAR